MSSQVLQAELLNLIQESRRKNADLRNAAEESLNELKALPSTSEAQIRADLFRKPKFPEPFIIACHSRHVKLAGIGVVCLQRLVASRSLPPERLNDVLSGLKESMSLGLDIQLKILQTLPSLLQHYSDILCDELLAATLEVSAALQASKTVAVSSTAAATLQQLVVSVFERVSAEDKHASSKQTVSIKDDGQSVDVGYSAYDALRVLDDLCRLIDGEALQFLRIKSLSPTFTLELIESILVNSGSVFVEHSELTQVLRTRLMPLIVRYLSERHNFAQTVRITRILLVLLRRYTSLLTAETEMALGLLTHLVEPDGTAPWKRVLCMEVFRGLYADAALVRLIYSLFDGQEGRKDILKDHMASLVRLAAEKPALIGVGNQSTVPLRPEHSRSATDEQITLEVGGVAGVIGTSVPSTETNVPGISSHWSVARIPYMDLLDKAEAPSPPDTYIYSIVLNCISTLAEGLARFILPLTVYESKSKRRNRVTSPDRVPSPARSSQELQRPHTWKGNKRSPTPINPLELESHPQLSAIRTCAGIIENCWPAILATCSTFLYAALDDEFYHNLVRSFQKLAHVAGLLRLSVPRDAFLTTIGKAALPADSSSPKGPATTAGQSRKTSSAEKPRQSTEMSLGHGEDSMAPSESPSMSLSSRHLLCMRALLNLGIALGSTLDQSAWSIILETLQHTDLMIDISSMPATKSNTEHTSSEAGGSSIEVPKANFGAEIIAVQSASAKMLESTSDYPEASFDDVLIALLNLSGLIEASAPPDTAKETTGSPRSPKSQRRPGHMHQNARRVSLTVGKSRLQEEELKFVLEKLLELSTANSGRLSSLEEGDHKAWKLLTDRLISSAANNEVSPALRLKAGETLNGIVFQTMKQKDEANGSIQNRRQLRNLQTLRAQIESLYAGTPRSSRSLPVIAIEIHERALDTLKNVLEQYAETFSGGWPLVFDSISSVFDNSGPDEDKELATKERCKASVLGRSPRLVRAAYKSLQLIVSDFLTLLPAPCLLELVDSFSKFASQQEDFNISLTTTSFFWNVSDYLQGQIERFSIESQVDASVSEEKLVTLSKDEDPSVSRNSLWLLLLLRIVDLTADSRSEIRNTAVHTLLRVFDAYGQQLAPKAWRLCLNRVLFRMIDEVQTELKKSANAASHAHPHELNSWAETTVVMVKGLSELMTNFFDSVVQDEEFDQSWERLLGSLNALIKLQRLQFSEATFSSLASILLRVQTPGGLSKRALRSAWTLWGDGHPAGEDGLIDLEEPNQDAALAYLRSFQQIYRLYHEDLTGDHIKQVLQHMRLVAWNSVSPRYSPDTDRPSSVQISIIDCMKTICSDKEGSQPDILFCLADFVDSALAKWSRDSDSRRPTFVAFSKSAIDLLSWYIADFGIKQDVFSNGSLTTALEHLAGLITNKYKWQGKDREPYLWQKATTASLNILQIAIPYVVGQYSRSTQPEISRFWDCVVDIAQGIVSASGYKISQLHNTTILTDESFDIAAVNRMKTLIIPSLGASAIPDSIRQRFACALFHSSFIYSPQRFDLPSTSVVEDPLKDIYNTRPGRTFDPPSTLRPNMVYVLLDTMFELSSTPQTKTQPEHAQNQTTELTSLARSLSPILILRCAVSLKSYIADQPLRGLMPQPTPARKVLLHLLNGMVQLQSEPSAIPDPKSSFRDASGNDSHGKHLEWIYPLVVRAVQVAGKERDDGLVLQALGRVLDGVGMSGI